MTKYFISGDGTGITYGVYEGDIISSKLIKGGLENVNEARRLIKELEYEDKNEKKDH